MKYVYILISAIIIGAISHDVFADEDRKNKQENNFYYDDYGIARASAIGSIQMDLNIRKIQIGAAYAINENKETGFEAKALGIMAGKRLCAESNKCGFYGMAYSENKKGRTAVVTGTWTF